MSKDPRADVYGLLKKSDKPELEQELRDYFFAMIGKDEALTNVEAVKTQMAELQTKFDTQTTELTTLQNATPATPDAAQKQRLDAVENELKTIKQEKADLITSNNSSSLSTSLDTLLGNIDPITKAASISALKSSEGLTVGGKVYKASFDGATTLFDAGGENLTAELGIASIMEAGMKDKVVGATGGGFPAFGATEEKKALSFDEAINAELKG